MKAEQEILKNAQARKAEVLAGCRKKLLEIQQKKGYEIEVFIPQYQEGTEEGPLNPFHDLETCLNESSAVVEELEEPVIFATRGDELAVPVPGTHKRYVAAQAAEQRAKRAKKEEEESKKEG